MHRRLNWLVVVAAWPIVLGTGCDNVEWNWDWWQSPRRTVRPRPESRTAAKDAADEPKAHAESGEASRAGGRDSAPVTTTAVARGSGDSSRAFYQVYLLAAESTEKDERGELSVVLKRAPPRPAAMLLEQLYVPTGRSGGETDCYLLYENLEEFEAAATIAPVLDVAPVRGASDGISALDAGIGLYLAILGEGAIVEPSLIEACAAQLARAAANESLARRSRWAAAVLAARVSSAYGYDTVAARGHLDTAAALAEDRSVERMTVAWWRAETYRQDGKRFDELQEYRAILAANEVDRSEAQIVRRSRAAMKEAKRE